MEDETSTTLANDASMTLLNEAGIAGTAPEDAESAPAPLVVQRGLCQVLFAYDVGLSIDLDESSRLITGVQQREKFKHKRRAPKYFEFHIPPLRISHQNRCIGLGALQTLPTVDLVVYEFGAISINYGVTIEGPLAGLLPLSADLHNNEALLEDSRQCVQRILGVIAPAVSRLNLSETVEDYVIYQIQSLAPTAQASDLKIQYGGLISQILRSEHEEALSKQEIEDALSCWISYGPQDASIIDWNASILFGDDVDDVRTVLEFANVELLEMRFLDEQLDDAMEQTYQLMSRRRRRRFPGRMDDDLRRVALLQVDSALLFEGVNNALKLLGDQYLARVYRLTSQRFHLAEWDGSILRKLQTLESIYQKMSDRASIARMELLEWIIIALIAVSILIPLLPGGGH